MLIIVTGGSGSGKSEFAESLLSHRTTNKYYLATMLAYGEEGKRRVDRHRKLREGKGFITIEQPVDVVNICEKIVCPSDSAVLLECMSNLIANEMFSKQTKKAQADDRQSGAKSIDSVADKVMDELLQLEEQLDELVIVTNNVFEDGMLYDVHTMEYMQVLGRINQKLCEKADQVIEVVVGIPISIKGSEIWQSH